MAIIQHASLTDSGVRVSLQGRSEPLELPAYWLADHDEGERGCDPKTMQRRINTLALPDDLVVTDARVQAAGESIVVSWRGRPATLHSAATLARLGEADVVTFPEAQPWRASALGEALPSVSFAEVMESSAGVRDWLRHMWSFGFCFVDGTPPNQDAAEQLVRRVGYPRETVFGGMWTFGADATHDDTAYSREALPLHTDGTYTLDPPGWQMLHCIEYDGEGGASRLTDGFAVAAAIREASPQMWETLCSTQITGRYIGDGVHLVARHPVVTLDDAGRPYRIAYNNGDRAPMWLGAQEMARFYAAWNRFTELAHSDEFMLRFNLRPGRMLVFDNWRLLHGRDAFVGKRTLTGAYLNREDVESAWRVVESS